MVFGRALVTLAGDERKLTKQMIRQAEWVAGVEYDDDQRELMLEGTGELLEDCAEPPYRVDRMLQQLVAAGKLDSLVGVGVGDFSTCTDDRYPERPIDTVIEEVVAPLGIPLVTDLPFGHVRRNVAWPVGGRATLDGEQGELEILESGVEAGAGAASSRRPSDVPGDPPGREG